MSAERTWWEEADPVAWDAFVQAAAYRSFPQLWAWGELRRPYGWRPLRVLVGEPGAPVAGAQLLVRRAPVLGLRLGYVPRGPVGAMHEPAVRELVLAALRAVAGREGIATLKVDPEATADSAYGAALLATPWRAASSVQPRRTRVVDLASSEADLLAELHHKHRQYVRKAERAGVTIEWVDGSTDSAVARRALTDFGRIYAHTAMRAGFVARAPAYYERVWELFAPSGHASLAFATLDGDRQAALFHFTCGDRAAEAYGGMTDAGAASRANYLLKWEAIRHFREAGLATYDLWGLATGGIARFKEGFGGREVVYVSARDLALRPMADLALRVLQPAYGIAQRARLRLSGRRLAGSEQ